MKPIRFRFVLGNGWGSWAISLVSFGHLSHVDVETDDGNGLIGARSDDIGGGSGVRLRPYPYEKVVAVVRIELQVLEEQHARFWAFIEAQIGKPYDKLAIFAFVIDRNWRDEDAWFCSELQARALEVAGVLREAFLPVNKVTPVMLAELLTEIGGKIIT